MMRRLIGPKASITFLLSITLFFYTVSIGCAYPIIAEVEEDEEMVRIYYSEIFEGCF